MQCRLNGESEPASMNESSIFVDMFFQPIHTVKGRELSIPLCLENSNPRAQVPKTFYSPRSTKPASLYPLLQRKPEHCHVASNVDHPRSEILSVTLISDVDLTSRQGCKHFPAITLAVSHLTQTTQLPESCTQDMTKTGDQSSPCDPHFGPLMDDVQDSIT